MKKAIIKDDGSGNYYCNLFTNGIFINSVFGFISWSLSPFLSSSLIYFHFKNGKSDVFIIDEIEFKLSHT